jgi:site-specific recombinase XerD
MKWKYWLELYLGTHCTARGLAANTIKAYAATLRFFQAWVEARPERRAPDEIQAVDVLEYVEFLRKVRENGDSAVNRVVTILRGFYKAMVAMGHLDHRKNPLAYFPTMKAPKRKFADTLTPEEVKNLVNQPGTDTLMGLRDRTMMILLYGTGIRASECSGIREKDIDLEAMTVRVLGKGGSERTVPLNPDVARALAEFRLARGGAERNTPFFRSRKGKAMSRNAIYERVRTHSRRAKIAKRVSPHRIRHTFATHLVRAGVNLVTLRDLLGHRQLSSTQIYIHMTAEDLRKATTKHPISGLVKCIKHLLPNVKLPFQHGPGQQRA